MQERLCQSCPMTIDVNAAGVLAQIFSVALLILALEGRFLRRWKGSRRIAIARYIVAGVGFVSLILTLLAEVSLVQAVMRDTPVSEGQTLIVVVAGWSLCLSIAMFLGGTIAENTLADSPPQ